MTKVGCLFITFKRDFNFKLVIGIILSTIIQYLVRVSVGATLHRTVLGINKSKGRINAHVIR